MRDINRVTLVGRLTADCELRALPSGDSVCNLRLASNSHTRDGAGGDWSERPGFYDVSMFGARVDNLATYLTRGRRVGIDGRLRWRAWEGEDGKKHQAVSIVADTIQFFDAPGGRGEEPPLDDADLVGAAVGDGEEDVAF
ncbi:MAG: single-stranded DNA-binding protein [Solirubrobacteraceae bacterium]